MYMNFRNALLGIVLAVCPSAAAALDLPIKKVNGVDNYYYEVKRGDTLYSLTRRLGVTREDLIHFNRAAEDGLRAGMVLYFPVSQYRDVKPVTPSGPTVTAGTTHGQAASAPHGTIRYEVKRGDTLFGLSHKFNVTAEEIIALNPSTNNGLRAGEVITIPANDGSDAAATADTPERPIPTVAPQDNSLTPVRRPVVVVDSEEPEDSESTGEPVSDPLTVEPQDNSLTPVRRDIVPVESVATAGKIAVLLPLMLNEENPVKHARLNTDFVRGMILAADRAGERGDSVTIEVFDTQGDVPRIGQLMRSPFVGGASVIVGPDNAASLQAIVGATDDEAYVFNIMAVQDTLYLNHDNIIQANIPHKQMYEKALQAIDGMYAGYTPVFLMARGGRSDKAAFTDAARSHFRANGVDYKEILFDGALSQREIEELDPAARHVFIPASGSLSEFNKFARALQTFRESKADPSEVALFGYPDWTIFRADAAEQLHRLEATLYSRFFCDETDADVTDFNRAFQAKFGVEPAATVPSQAMLGYDTARYLIEAMRNGRGRGIDLDNPAEYRGLQSAFRFDGSEAESNAEADAENTPGVIPATGPVNTALYIITYLPGNGVATRII